MKEKRQSLRASERRSSRAHFAPEVGYQEEARAILYARLGARVLVLTSTNLSANARTLIALIIKKDTQFSTATKFSRLPTVLRTR